MLSTKILAISENTITLFVCPRKFGISIVFVFSWDHCKPLDKLETMLMQNLGGQTKSIVVFSEMAYRQFPGSLQPLFQGEPTWEFQ